MSREIIINSTTDVLADVQRAAGMEPTPAALLDETARIEDKLAEAEKRAAVESQAATQSQPEAREEPQGEPQTAQLERIVDRHVEETLARMRPKPKPALPLPPGPVLFRDWDDAMQAADKTTVLPQWLQERIVQSPYRDVLVYGLARNRRAFDDVVKHSNAGDKQGAFRVLGILEGQFLEAAAAQQRRNNLAQAIHHQRPRRSARASNPGGTPRHPHAGGPSVGKSASSAPAPVAQLRGSSTAGAASIYDPGISQAEYNRLRDGQKAARRRTGYVGREG
jgi:hypothetical protein